MDGDDRDLREFFSALRREEEARVPPMSRLLLAAREHRRSSLPGKRFAATACLATIAAAAVWLLPKSHFLHEQSDRGREQAAASIADWKPATDFLLETPGRELLQSVPAIGVWHGMPVAPVPGRSPRHLRKQVLP